MPTSSLKDVAIIMAQIDSGAVPVVDEGKVIGLITDRDIVVRGVAKDLQLDQPVSEIMSTDIQSCLEEDSVADAAAKMGSHQLRRLVVYNAQGMLAGMISIGDIAVDFGAKAVGHTLEEISGDTSA